MSVQINNIRPEFDREIVDIVDYVRTTKSAPE